MIQTPPRKAAGRGPPARWPRHISRDRPPGHTAPYSYLRKARRQAVRRVSRRAGNRSLAEGDKSIETSKLWPRFVVPLVAADTSVEVTDAHNLSVLGRASTG